jgi:hypothetical protein
VDRCSNLPFHLQSIADEALTALANLFRGCHGHSQGILQIQLIRKCGDTFDSFFLSSAVAGIEPADE